MSFSVFAINRFANINMHVYYSAVRGRPSQLLDRTQLLNYAIKTRPTVLRFSKRCTRTIDILISRPFPLLLKHGSGQVTRPVVYCMNPTVHSQCSMLLVPPHRPLARAPIRQLIHRCMETKVLHTLFTFEDLCPQTTSRPQDLEHTAQKRYYDNNLYRYRNNNNTPVVLLYM